MSYQASSLPGIPNLSVIADAGIIGTMDRKPSAKQPPKSDPTPPRRGRAASVGRDANYTAMAAFARTGFADPALVLHWQDIVGPEVARLGRPGEIFHDGTITALWQPGRA